MRTATRLSRSGLTLLELLLVVFILSLLAFSAVSLTNTLDEQMRFEETRSRLEQIKKAVIGRPDKALNGQAVVDGFVADIGRLPNSLQELLLPGTLPAWQYDSAKRLWAGWRGPYLQSMPLSNGATAYYDGWGNIGPAPDFGWSFQLSGQSLFVQSFGSDGLDDGATPPTTEYARDYPPDGSSFIQPYDHQLNIRGWTVTVKFDNPLGGGGSLPSSTEELRLRLYYPQEGTLDWPANWPSTDAERDQQPYLSARLTLAANEVADGATVEKVFTFETGVDKFVPWGIRSLAVVRDSDGSLFPAGQPHVTTLLPRTQLAPITMLWNLE
ncbi:MAG: hypothetical protein KatS3mg105_1625 [Gemmatales bacterium]|nr:MAG: hypothetical protein KatS3mg105_1625 [Gemmatales bacterium]